MANFQLFSILTIFFIAMGVLLPFIKEDLGQPVWDVNADSDVEDMLLDAEDETNTVGIMGVLWGIFRMFTYVGGGFPFLFEVLILYPLRILWIFVFIDVLPFT